MTILVACEQHGRQALAEAGLGAQAEIYRSVWPRFFKSTPQ